MPLYAKIIVDFCSVRKSKVLRNLTGYPGLLKLSTKDRGDHIDQLLMDFATRSSSTIRADGVANLFGFGYLGCI